MTRSSLAPLAALVLALTATGECQEAQTAAGPARWIRRTDNTFFFVLNPLGIMDSIDVAWMKKTSRREDLLHKDAHIAAGLSNRLAPAFVRTSAWFEYSPLSVIDLRVGAEPIYYLGTFKAFIPFDSPSANFDDETLEARRGEAASGFAGRAYFSPTLKARAGAVMMRVRAEVSYWKASQAGEPWFYEPILDTLIADGSTTLNLEALVLREIKLSPTKTLLLGPVYDLTTVSDASKNRKQDVGLIAVWAKSGAFHALKDPAFSAKIVYFVEDPVRRHEPAAFLTVAFGF